MVRPGSLVAVRKKLNVSTRTRANERERWHRRSRLLGDIPCKKQSPNGNRLVTAIVQLKPVAAAVGIGHPFIHDQARYGTQPRSIVPATRCRCAECPRTGPI